MSYKNIKRVLDILFSLLLLLLLTPLMVIISIVIKFSEPNSPILFSQKRPGKNERIFTIYKFRTMTTGVRREDSQASDTKRITKVGNILRKTSLDELPQLFNIIKGDMSFIGPRPLLPQYLELYSNEQKRRHDVYPGITGWAQVNGRNAISWEEKFKYDIYYVDNISFKLDLKIFFLTIYKIIKRKDINSSDSNTMETFTGSNKTNTM
ncbi:sugar transferase [Desulfuribacillus alkaliarsenatis]|uniref:Bacterial sugar transferase domain-containing protein n=1 Tax=Desulfuribacillus alkaliarsenatis TaxID=766136 RepID=A0A1E5G1W0_9FIRM|nr:sugar transferase [Desulfuribacillus alkaliarsenatis]OEF96816.1 hypothetical protein BHF68_07075 [Desulfuribacillus alkaliarsenatis]